MYSEHILQCDTLDINVLPTNSISRLRINIGSNGLGDPYQIPVIVLRGKKPGNVLGITAALHGNELNGLPIIFDIIKKTNLQQLKGTIIAVPVVNIDGYLNNNRFFCGTYDLNRLFPGKLDGTRGQIYAYDIMEKIIKHFDYLIDLHTASFGRSNSLYVRADLTSSVNAKIAYLQNPQIIVHNCGQDGTLRNAASALGIHAITIEIGNPLRFQKKLIGFSLNGIRNVLTYLNMLPRPEKPLKGKPVICKSSFWMYTQKGGVLEVIPDIVSIIKKGDIIGRLRNMYGDVIEEYLCPEDSAIVIGKNLNPVGDAGSRIVHLGIIGTPS